MKASSASGAELAHFFRRLHCMVSSGVTVHRALAVMGPGEQAGLSGAVAGIQERLEAGKRLSQAMNEHPWIFPPLCVHVLAAAEVSGRMVHCLATLADTLERSDRLRRQLITALAYPLMVLISTLGLLVFLVVFILPREEEIYASLGTSLPMLTQVMMGAAHWAFHPYVLVPLAGLGLAGAYSWEWYARSLRPTFDRLVLRLPGLGPVLHKLATVQMLAGLSSMLEAGLRLSQTSVVGQLSGNAVLDERYQGFLGSLRAGATLGQALDDNQCFPPLVRHIFRMAEEHGQMVCVLRKTAAAFDDEVEIALATMAAMLEPVALLFLGATVGTVVLASILPTFSLLGRLT